MTYPTKESYRKAWDSAIHVDPPIPLNLDLELASACNLACPFCSWGESAFAQKMKEDKSIVDGKPLKRFMPKELAFRLIEEAAEIGIPALKLNYRGESTLHPDFSEIVLYAKRKSGYEYGSHTSEEQKKEPHIFPDTMAKSFHDILINTNANCQDHAIEGLMACTKVMISLDSMEEETYDQIRIGGKLEEAVKTINRIVLRKHPNVWIRRVICKTNEHEDFVGAVKAHWGDSVKVSEHFAFDRNDDTVMSVHEADVSSWDRKFCGYPSQRVVVMADGTFSPCCLAWKNEFKMGFYGPKENGGMSLAEYWAGKQRKALVGQLKKSLFKNDLCKTCPSYVSYKRPEAKFVGDIEGRAKI